MGRAMKSYGATHLSLTARLRIARFRDEEIDMGRAMRAEQFSATEVGIVHCVQRCVRRAFLSGKDPVSGKDFGFRREWIRRRMEALASAFAVDVLNYAILSNHIHLILRHRPDVVRQWTDEEVAIRWLKVFPGRRIEEHLGEPTTTDVEMLCADKARLWEVRQRLSDISWFMRALCEPIARMANHQDQVTGRFWEGRFKAQKITDEAGLLACAMYVDLNPVRAAMAATPEGSKHTSAYDRIKATKGQEIEATAFDLRAADPAEVGAEICSTPVDQLTKRRKSKRRSPTGRRILRDAWLSPLTLGGIRSDDPQVSGTGIRASDKGFLSLSLSDYLTLLDWTGRQKLADSQAAIPKRLVPILSRLGINGSMWRDLVWNFKRYFGRSSSAGRPENMASEAASSGKCWAPGQKQARQCFVPA